MSVVAATDNRWNPIAANQPLSLSVTNTSRTSALVEDISGKQPYVLFHLNTSQGERHSLNHQLWVLSEQMGDLFLVADNSTLGLFATGASPEEALAQYGDAVLDYYGMLRERAHQGRLGRNQVGQLRLLTTLLAH